MSKGLHNVCLRSNSLDYRGSSNPDHEAHLNVRLGGNERGRTNFLFHAPKNLTFGKETEMQDPQTTFYQDYYRYPMHIYREDEFTQGRVRPPSAPPARRVPNPAKVMKKN